MLRCPCEIIKPFTYVTTKKSSVLRGNSVLRVPLGCSCYHTKSIFLHVVRSKQFCRKDWDVRKSLFREQKNFIWTSFLFWNNKGDKINSDANDTALEATATDKKKETSDSVSLSENSPKSSDLNAVKISSENNDKALKITKFIKVVDDATRDEGGKEIAVKGTAVKDNVITNQIFGPADTVEATEVGKNVNKSTDLGFEKLEKCISETFVLSEGKAKNSSNSNAVIESIPGINSNVQGTHISLKNDSQKGSEFVNEKIILNTKIPSLKKEDGEVKRQTQEINLGGVNVNLPLQEPPGICNSETGRAADEIRISKDTSPKMFLEKAKNILRKTTSTLKTEDSDNRCVKIVNLGTPKGDINLNVTTKRRQTVDLNRCSTERNFITPVRAMTDFLLKPSDLEGLRKTKRRSPYENDPPITVYWRKDVEAKAIDVWGSKENLLKEILKRDIERRRYQQNLFTVKRRLRDYRREQGRESEVKMEQNGLFGSSGKVVLTAIAINGTNFLFKLIAWIYTGSHSMFSETIHSLADTINQLILAYGIHKSVQRADSDHPYGYTNMRYVSSLISGVGIFCVGSGLSFYHGFVGLTDPSDLPSFYWAYFILGGSLASEGATLLVAFNSIRLGARKSDMSFSEYVLRGQDPSVNVVLLEDVAAVVGVCFAGCCMGLSSHYDSHIPDAVGSFLVGGLLAGVASFIIYTNVAALVGRSIPQERLDKINAELESDVMIRAIHDVKGIDIGNSLVRYKAEMDFDGGELTRSYLDKQDLNQMLEDVKKMKTIDELEEFMLKHGENIVDMMGGEIDRIELKLRKKHPEIRHCDLEIL